MSDKSDLEPKDFSDGVGV